MSVDYIQVPPDSTGKRVQQNLGIEVTYVNGTIAFAKGDVVVGQNSGTTGVVIEVEGTTAAGTIYLRHTFGTPKVFTAAENLQVNAVTNAEFSNQTNFYTQKVALVSGDNPLYEQVIDNKGQAFTRFAEGAPQFDAFGKLRVSESATIAEYIHEYDTLPESYGDTTATGGTIAHMPGEAGVKLSCTTSSGSQAKRVSHTYHPYAAGRSQLIEMTVAPGDTGKANVKRIWGYGDDNDGVFFQLNGTTMQVMIRNSTGSTAAEVTIDQADWGSDKLDGTGLSGFTLDVSKVNIYWIDLQWLGAGQVRFGVVTSDGERVVCHHEEHANLLNSVYMRTASLPIYFEQINTGVSASTSEFKTFCAVVKTEGVFEPKFKGFAGTLPKKTVTGTGTYLGSFRSKQTYKSVDNRIIALGDFLDLFSDTELISIELWKNPTLSGSPTWLGDPGSDSSVEFDTAATGITGGTLVKKWLIPTGTEKEVDLKSIFSFAGELMRRHATVTNHDTYSFICNLETGTTTDVWFTANWKELRD
jgi:hypothetical protein